MHIRNAFIIVLLALVTVSLTGCLSYDPNKAAQYEVHRVEKRTWKFNTAGYIHSNTPSRSEFRRDKFESIGDRD